MKCFQLRKSYKLTKLSPAPVCRDYPIFVAVDDENYEVILPPDSQANLETPKVTYVSNGWGAQTFVSISSLADFIATNTGNKAYVVYADSNLYHTPEVSFANTSGMRLVLVNSIEEISPGITRESLERGIREISESSLERMMKGIDPRLLCKIPRVPC